MQRILAATLFGLMIFGGAAVTEAPAAMAMPAAPVAQASGAVPVGALAGAKVIKVDHRGRRYDDRDRRYDRRYDHRYDRRYDRRDDRRDNGRYDRDRRSRDYSYRDYRDYRDYRRHDRNHKRGSDKDAAYILGGVLGAAILLGIMTQH